MKDIRGVDVNGHVASGLDLTIRARTVKNQVVAFTVTETGTMARCGNSQIILPEEIQGVDKIADLLAILKFSKGDISEDNKLELLPIQSNNLLRAVPPIGKSACSADVCAAVTCADYDATCAGLFCASAACGEQAAICASESCAAAACAAQTPRCAADACAAAACATQGSLCSAEACAGAACAAQGSTCTADACAGAACLVDVMPCAADVQAGPCLVDLPYCPFIL